MIFDKAESRSGLWLELGHKVQVRDLEILSRLIKKQPNMRRSFPQFDLSRVSTKCGKGQFLRHGCGTHRATRK
jgi:hypothetical protein